jgi:hypothetical protein
MPYRSDFGTPCCLHPSVAGSALGATHFRGHIHVHCCYGPVTRSLPKGDLVDRLQDFGFPPPCYPNYGAPDYCPGRLNLLLNTPALLDTQPDVRIARIRLSDKTSRLRPRHVMPKPAQTYEPEVPVKVREWIGPALASPGFVLDAQPPAQPHSGVVVEHPICF